MTEDFAVHIAGQPVDWAQTCSRCDALIQDNTAWWTGRVAVPTADAGRGPTWWPVGERVGRGEHPNLPTITYLVGDRPLDEDEHPCTEEPTT